MVPEELECRAFRIRTVHIDVKERYWADVQRGQNLWNHALHDYGARPLGIVRTNTREVGDVASGGKRVLGKAEPAARDLFRRILIEDGAAERVDEIEPPVKVVPAQ